MLVMKTNASKADSSPSSVSFLLDKKIAAEKSPTGKTHAELCVAKRGQDSTVCAERGERNTARERERARGTGSGEKTHNRTPFTFEWKMSMSFSGNTGAEGKENEVGSFW
jgi:hypothetical protein